MDLGYEEVNVSISAAGGYCDRIQLSAALCRTYCKSAVWETATKAVQAASKVAGTKINIPVEMVVKNGTVQSLAELEKCLGIFPGQLPTNLDLQNTQALFACSRSAVRALLLLEVYLR